MKKYVLLLTNGEPEQPGKMPKIIAQKQITNSSPSGLVKDSFFNILPGELSGQVGKRLIKKGDKKNPGIIIHPKAYPNEETLRRKLENDGWIFFTP